MKILCHTELMEPATSRPTRDHDSLMQCQAQQDTMPQRNNPRTKKDKLFNDLIDLFEAMGWSWIDSGSKLGKSFLLMLRDLLWYIDAVFESRSFHIPEIFK